MKNLNYLMDHILHQIFNIILIYIKKAWVGNRITLKIKIRCYLQLLTSQKMKLLASAKSNLTKDKNGENIPYLEVFEVVLMHCNVINNI